MEIRVWPDGEWQETSESPHSYKSDDYMVLDVLDPLTEDSLDALELAINAFVVGHVQTREEVLNVEYKTYVYATIQVFKWQDPESWDKFMPEEYGDFFQKHRLLLNPIQKAIEAFYTFID
ncbi:hypothetical protein [Vibrio owensii]|uniref:hypothetical protein n=1 Tax=Vibrio harveyi group TaxID=717610 RepID=UPI003CC5135B